MENRAEITKAFRKARIAGEKLLSQGKITWKSSELMVKMTNRRIRLGIDWVLKKGETVDEVANNLYLPDE